MAANNTPFALALPQDPRLSMPLPLSAPDPGTGPGSVASVTSTVGPALLAGAGTGSARFPANSRYQDVPTSTLTLEDGRTVVYLLRRPVPQPEDLAPIKAFVVSEGDRLDNMTAEHLDDPELFWRLCDSNRALDPAEVEEVGRRVVVSWPAGFSMAASGSVDDLGGGTP